MRMKKSKECGSMRRTIMNVVAIASLCLMASFLAAEAQPPDATLKVHTASIAVGVGYSWGGGIVTFQGQEYPGRVDGLSVGEVGISSAGAVLAGGGDVTTMRNQHGVVIDLIGTSQGAKIMLAVQGVKIALEGAP